MQVPNWPRVGRWAPLKAIAALAGVVVGGVLALGVVMLVTLVLTVIGFATAGVGWLLTYGWIVAAFLIYHAIRSRQSPKQRAYTDSRAVADDAQREREYQRRLAQMQQCSGTAQPRPRKQQSSVGAGVLAVVSGFVLALGANVGLSGLNLPPLANTILPPLTGAVAGIGVFAALKRWVINPPDEEKPPAREIKRQIGRIRRKSRDLSREATEAGGVFNGLDTQADRLAEEAQELADRLFELRRVARDVRRKIDAARGPAEPHSRLDDLLNRNRAAQRQCLTQIERIEDLLDVARLEIACPDESLPVDHGREELMQEVETELEAARRALREVQQQSEVV
ncbi:MAG: hypothetical protein R6V07_17300 [Armatimonadota bacterium]